VRGRGTQSRAAHTGIYKGTGAALELGVIALTRQHSAHLLHVGYPVYFCVWKRGGGEEEDNDNNNKKKKGRVRGGRGAEKWKKCVQGTNWMMSRLRMASTAHRRRAKWKK